MSVFPVWHELSLMCQICQIFSTMLKEAFVKVEEQAAWRRWPAEWTDCQIQLFCVSVLSHGSIVEAGQADPHHEDPTVLPALYACQPSPFPWEGFHCPPPPPPSNQTPWMLHWSRKNNQLPFCFSSHLNRTKKTYGNEALSCVVQTVGVMWFAFQWCGAVQLQLPAANRGLQPADRAPAHSNAQVLLLLLLLLLPKHTAPTFSTCSLIIHGENK